MQQRIGVIGSGMAGLATAWICRRAGHEVTIFESQARRGMDAHTLDIANPAGSGWVDVPLRVMSPHAWGNVLALSEQVGVSTFTVDTFVSCSWLDQETWLRTSRLAVGKSGIPFVGSWRYLGLNTWKIIQGLRRLSSCTRELVESGNPEETLGSVAQRYQFEPLFFRGLVLPLLATICTCRETYLLQWPARDLLLLLHKILHGLPLLRLKGGTRQLVEGLSRELRFISGSPVVKLQADASGVLVENSAGQGGRFDRVILGTQANQTPFLSRESFARELDVLSRFEFDSGELIVHRDVRLMPRRFSDWTALNYLMDRDLKQSMFTVWVNPVEPSIAKAEPIFQTWNPILPIDSDKIVSRVSLQRAVTTLRNRAAWDDLSRLHAEPDRRVFFCGSWAAAGVPLLESAVRSAMAVTRQLGLETPWNAASPSDEPRYRSMTDYMMGARS
jgi:predicted NAD/FAD-binding protein